MTQRKSVAICVYLFDTLCLEARRLTPDEFISLEAAFSKHSIRAPEMAKVLTEYLRRQ